MITVKYDKPKKLASAQSIFVSFPYKQVIVDTIRSIPERYWDGKNKMWELPYSALKELQNKLSNEIFTIIGNPIDDRAYGEKIIEKTYEIPEQVKTDMFNFQKDGYNELMNFDKYLLLDSQGCISGDMIIDTKHRDSVKKYTLRNLNRAWQNGGLKKDFQISCLLDTYFGWNDVEDIIYSGQKEVYEIELDNGYTIEATKDHKILTNVGYKELKDITMFDMIMCNIKPVCSVCGCFKNVVTSKNNRYHGVCRRCLYDYWIREFGVKRELISYYPHKQLLTFPQEQKVLAIRYIGVKDTYDIKMKAPYHNFIANGVVVHNCGKSITTLAVALQRQALNKINHCLIICGVNGLKYNWQNEIKQHTGMSSMILGNRKNKKGIWSAGSNADKLEDLDNLTEFFIITNVESLRDKNIRDKLRTLFDKKVIEMCICDEIHKCFIYDTNILTNKGYLKIGDIVTKNLDVLVASYNRYKDIIEYKKIINRFENVRSERKIKLEMITKSSRRELICTENHLIQTKYKGWVKAKDLERGDEFLRFRSIDPEFSCLANKEYIDSDWSLMYDLEIEGNHNYFAEGYLVHNCKSPSSQQGKALLLLAKHIKYFYGLTGTVIKNNPLDIYVPLKCVGKEPANFTQFKSRYCEFGGFGGYQIIGYKHLDELQRKLDTVSLRRTKEEVLELPPKVYIDDYVEMGVKQKRIYNAVLKAVLEDIDNISLSLDPLAQLIRLRQATADTSILSSAISESAKIERLKDIVEECVSNNQKIIVFSNWTKVTNIVYNKLKEYNPAIITGEVKDREKEKNKFMTDSSCKIIIGTIGAMGTGYTLTEATTAVFLDEPYTWADKEQAADRIYRIGTKSSVNIITLLCKNTIDEYIHRLVNKKKVLGDAVVDKRYNLKNKEVLKFILTGEGNIE